jgi:hypothetical protein
MQAAVELFLESTLKSVTLYFSFLFFCGCTRSGLAQNCQNSFLDQGNRCIREPSHLFESIVIVGLPPQADIHELENIALGSNEEDVKKPRNIFGNNHHQVHALSNLEPQVLFAYPPERPLPLKYKDILSFCLPGGVQVHAVERTPSFSELNEILLGQEQLKESNQSFVFRLQVADDSTLYGCCVLVEEIVQRPSKLVSMLTSEKPVFPRRSRYVITTPRCYCIFSRLPFFELHFGVLQRYGIVIAIIACYLAEL